jgi:tripartite-type tricarboxylate transporter receptor subunit TctC
VDDHRACFLAMALAMMPGVTLLAAHAQESRDVAASKTFELVVSEAVGGGSDTMARLVSRHIGRHLPGQPNVIVRNMPGAGGLVAANYLYNVAPKDGSTIGMVEQSIESQQLFHARGLMADVTRFVWLGRTMSNNAVLFAWHTSPVKRIEDAYDRELAVSATGQSSLMRWTALKRITGLKFKLIVGHQGTAEAGLAMERGEIDALSAPWVVLRATKANWLRDAKINLLLQTGLDRTAGLERIPRVVDLAKTDEQRAVLELLSQPERIGRSLAAPPGVSAQMAATLRTAMSETFADPQFLADAASLHIDLDPLGGEALQKMIREGMSYSPDVVARAETFVQPE